jgi:hypothetical protein
MLENFASPPAASTREDRVEVDGVAEPDDVDVTVRPNEFAYDGARRCCHGARAGTRGPLDKLAALSLVMSAQVLLLSVSWLLEELLLDTPL